MRKIIFLLLLTTIFFLACNKNAGSLTESINERVDANATVVTGTMAGTFTSYGQNVAGTAKVYSQNGKLSLVLENFSTNNGPDLHVYLSKETMPVNFIDLGKLKSISGNQVYDIPGTPDFGQYKYALVHCQQYNHLFGSAELIK
ncbi:MAG: DM13 domain-containing protein [Bacteroidota bacterium]